MVPVGAMGAMGSMGAMGAHKRLTIQITGRMGAAQYFFAYELPKVKAWLSVVSSRDMTCANLSPDAF